jgi:hypothetical protein
MATKFDNIPIKEKECYLFVGWNLDCILRSGESPYVKVNLRRFGLREKPNKLKVEDWHEIIDLRPIRDLGKYDYEWWKSVYEVVDKKKFFLARIRLGF